jgi:hypothetical protein
MTSNLSSDKLQEIILKLGENTGKEERSEFVRTVNQIIIKSESQDSLVEEKKPLPDIIDILIRIEDYRSRMENGEFFDADRDYIESHVTEYGHYRYGYNDYEEEGDYDYSNEKFVTEMSSLLESAGRVYEGKNSKNALKVYEAIFSIIDDCDNTNDEYFSWNFSFSEALGENNYKMHKIRFLRVFYLNYIQSDQELVFDLFSNQHSIQLSDIADAEKESLPGFVKFTTDYIGYLLKQQEKPNHLIDAIFVKGGMEELRTFAYKKGNIIPELFLAYYNESRDRGAGDDELLRIALDGINLIPEKYSPRVQLSKAVISRGEKTNDKNLLLTGYSTAFYSNPELAELNDYLGFIMQNSIKEELEKFELYLEYQKERINNKQSKSGVLMSVRLEKNKEISMKNYLLSVFILHGLKDVIPYIDYSILGFQGEKKHIPAILALLLITITVHSDTPAIENLANKYCFDTDLKASSKLRRLIYEKASKETAGDHLMTELKRCEKLAIDRVRHILQHKLRGGYESSCLLLTACAEAKQISDRSGNILIANIDKEFKRYAAFRRELKTLTKESRVLAAVT